MITVERLKSIFEKNYPRENRDAVWNYCMERAVPVELSEANLENMCQTALVTGFVGVNGQKELVKLAEALGISGMSNPEADAAFAKHVPSRTNVDGLTADQILDQIQTRLPFPIRFPPFSGNCTMGLATRYGVTSNRHIFYLWVLKRIREICPDPHTAILELGAGFGVLGYYLDQVGYRDYTTIDLALINACQAYFLSRNLPERNLILSGDVANPFDPGHRDSIKLLHASDFVDVPTGRFGIMINMDGLTEMGIAEATKYVQHDCAPMLLSINHEVNEFRVADIAQNRKLKSRYPFWLRDGYVEELYVRDA